MKEGGERNREKERERSRGITEIIRRKIDKK
jgi:hypothetical protein